ncbi:ubiquitin-like small modifier protein 1 [Haloparvum sedimenti]|uniref:ubiquitin-like small modifier protein 1 n=1 Tax=Haloparvum sedimenti TaxID=1678448 RepID=UPI00071E8809|nr:ubiquitin-like small modifier protein 1 [Haloparvum sedimenti]
MYVELRLFGPFRDDAGIESATLETDATTYRGLLQEVEARYPSLSGRLLDAEDDGLAGEVVVTRDGKNVRHLDGLDTPVSDGDVVRMIPSVYGGS